MMTPAIFQPVQLLLLLSGLILVLALAVPDLKNWPGNFAKNLVNRRTTSCRCFPGDSCWPSKSEWDNFNSTVEGKLVATIPIGSPCHDDSFRSYNQQQCDSLKDNWGFPQTHINSSSSVMASFFANQSCDPFLPRDSQCVVGSYVQYAVDAKDASDVQKAIDFVTKRNIRLTVRNTGHDYYGKATGAGALAIWTRHLRDIEVMDYASDKYTGKAMKMGAGVEVVEGYQTAHDNGIVVVGGNCPSVGLVGGYSMGGGHGPLATKWGLAADQILEWEVVTGAGEYLVATPSQNQDLYWAMTGGGGSTYGVALSATIRAHPDMQTTASSLNFMGAGVDADVYWDVIKTFISVLPKVLDSGAVSIWLASPDMFAMAPTTAPGITKPELESMFQPVIDKLDSNKIKYTYNTVEYPTYLDSYKAQNQPYNISEYNMGGRLIQRSTVEQKNDGLIAGIREIIGKGSVVSGVSFYTPVKPEYADNSVNPALRNSVFDAVLGLPYSSTNWTVNLENQRIMTDEIVPILEKLTPGGGSYLSEADFNQPNFQSVFYGPNYDKLRRIKQKYDPNCIFYAITGVGSEEFATDKEGRLCQKS